MALTLRAVLEEIDALLATDGGSIDEIGRDELVDALARAALLGARGNSGVILSQLIRGAAEELVSRPGELVDPIMIGAAMAAAAQRAYESVRAPAEGTMLTVMREMAARIAMELQHLPNPRLGTDWSDDLQNRLIADVLEAALESGEEAVRRGPELLPVLKEAGVVDAGGHAVTILFAGVVSALRGTEAPRIEVHAPAVRVTHPEHESSTYRYCTNFAVTGHHLHAHDFVAPLEALGDSVLVVGDLATLKVHVHTDEPERATALFTGRGHVSRLDVADMRLQVAEREERLGAPAAARADTAPTARCGALGVAAGAGMVALFTAEGVRALDGGQTLNPSTYELLAGIHEVPAEEVIVLPNSANVIMAAERAAELSDKTVRVVATRSMQEGLLAALALRPDLGAEENAEQMRAALGGVHTGAVARAGRADPAGRFSVGDAVGYVDEELVAWGDPAAALAAVLERLESGAELITCIAGDGAPLSDREVRELLDGSGAELELQRGDQPSWWWLLTAE
jgi:DAK2 domain fusion protein YloV